YSATQITSGGELSDRTQLNKRIKEELSDVVNWNAGAEVRLPFTGLFGRAGLIYQPPPFTSDPARFAQKALTCGAGYDSKGMVQVDLAYAYGWRGENESLQNGDLDLAEQKIAKHTF